MSIKNSQPKKCKPGGRGKFYIIPNVHIYQSLGSQNNGLISLLPKAQCYSLQQKRSIWPGIRQSNVLYGVSGFVACQWVEFYFLDSIAYEKLVSSISNKRLKKGIMKASPIEQTSCLEGFHSVLNQFSPKMIGYTYTGMFCRYSTIANE